MNIIEQYALGDERGKEEVMEKLDKAEKELNRSGQSAVSITDPEARFMKNKKERIELAYNSQITVEPVLLFIYCNPPLYYLPYLFYLFFAQRIVV